MDARRAKEIVSSPVMADVTYNGESIYIDSVDERNGTAQIHAIDEPYIFQDVPLKSLSEHK